MSWIPAQGDGTISFTLSDRALLVNCFPYALTGGVLIQSTTQVCHCLSGNVNLLSRHSWRSEVMIMIYVSGGRITDWENCHIVHHTDISWDLVCITLSLFVFFCLFALLFACLCVFKFDCFVCLFAFCFVFFFSCFGDNMWFGQGLSWLLA